MTKTTTKQLIFSFIFLVFLSLQGAVAQKFNTAKMDSLLQLLADNNKAMCSITLKKDGKIVYSKAIGYSQINGDTKTKSTTETKYRIGSISKMFTAAMIFQLIEEKKLSLDTKLSAYYPEIANAGKITIKNLLNHHSGIHNFTTDEDYLSWNTQEKTETEMLEIIKKGKPDFEPGTKGEYSNSNYVLLGYILEKISKKSYATNLQERITGKLNLKNTYYGSKTNPAKNEAYSYSYDGSKWVQESETDMSVPHGAGAILSTTEDLAVFIENLFAGKIVSESSLKEMKTMEDNYGKAVFIAPFDEHTGYGHTGGIDGFQSSLDYFPEDHMTLAFCGNGLNYNMNDIAIAALSIYFNKPYQLPSFKTVAVGTDILKSYEGVYSTKAIPLKLTIKLEGDHLTGQGTGQPAFPLESVSETEFKFDPAGVVIIFPKTGGLTLKQGGGSFDFTKE